MAMEARGSRFVKQDARGRNVFGSASTRTQFLLNSPALAVASLTASAPRRFTGGAGTVAAPVGKSATMPIKIDGQNRVAQLRPAPPLITLVIKSDGRFSGTYVPTGGSQFLHFSGLALSDRVYGVGVLTGGSTGFVMIGEPGDNNQNSGGSFEEIRHGGGDATLPPTFTPPLNPPSIVANPELTGVVFTSPPILFVPPTLNVWLVNPVEVIPVLPENPPVTSDVTGVTGGVISSGASISAAGGTLRIAQPSQPAIPPQFTLIQGASLVLPNVGSISTESAKFLIQTSQGSLLP
jgi:hypothetical protein